MNSLNKMQPIDKERFNDRNEYDSATRNVTNRNTIFSKEGIRFENDFRKVLYFSNLDAADTDLFISFLYRLMKDLCLLKSRYKIDSVRDVISGVNIGKDGSGLLFFVEFRDATAALELNNIPFMGKSICLKRPNTWEGPQWLEKARSSWDDKLEKFYSETRDTKRGDDSRSIESLPRRELAIKNIPSGWADAVLRYITSSMKQIGLVKAFEYPIENFRLYRTDVNTGLSVGILTFRTEEFAHDAFRLQNLPFLDKFIYFERCQNDPSMRFYQNNEQNWQKSMKEFFHKTLAKKWNGEVDSNRNEYSLMVKQEHNNKDGFKIRPEVTNYKVKESMLQNRTLPATTLSNKSRLLGDSDETIRRKDSEISHLVEKQAILEAIVKQVGIKLKESLLQNSNLSATLSNKSRLLETCEDTLRGKDSEISRLTEEHISLMATVKHIGIERDSLKKELGGNKFYLTKALTRLNEAHNTTITAQDSVEVDFLRKELEIKRAELQEKQMRIKELEVASERHMERIMNLTDGFLSGGTKECKLEEQMRNKRGRGRSRSLQTNLAKKVKDKGNINVDLKDPVIFVKEEDNSYGR